MGSTAEDLKSMGDVQKAISALGGAVVGIGAFMGLGLALTSLS